MSTLVNLSPADMSELSSLSPITFSVQGAAGGTVFAAVWVRYADSDDEILIYDGTSFQAPFAANSSIARPQGNDDLINFSIVPESGWLRAIDKFRVETEDVAAPPAFPPPAIDTMSPAQVASIISQAEPTWYWGHDGVDRVAGADLDESTSLPGEFTSAPLGGQIYRYLNGSATNIRAALTSPEVGNGAGTITVMAILDVTLLHVNRGIFGNRTNTAGNFGFMLEGSTGGPGGGVKFICDTPTDIDDVICQIGTGPQVVLMTRSVAGDILGIWTADDSTVEIAVVGDLTSDRPVQIGANAIRVSDSFDCGGIMEWAGTDGDFGTPADFAQARLSMSQALGFEP